MNITSDMSVVSDASLIVFFQVIIRIALAGAILSKFALLYAVVVKFSPSLPERLMRSIAATAGLLLYLGAKTIGLSIPGFMLHTLLTSGALLTGTLGALLPAAVGFVCAWYVNGYFSSRDARKALIGMRILALVMSVVVMLYADLFITAAKVEHNVDDLRLLMPNLTFTLAVMLFAVFRYIPPEPLVLAPAAAAATRPEPEPEPEPDEQAAVRNAWRRRNR